MSISVSACDPMSVYKCVCVCKKSTNEGVISKDITQNCDKTQTGMVDAESLKTVRFLFVSVFVF